MHAIGYDASRDGGGLPEAVSVSHFSNTDPMSYIASGVTL